MLIGEVNKLSYAFVSSSPKMLFFGLSVLTLITLTNAATIKLPDFLFEICNTDKCNDLGRSTYASLNTSASPCTDFYTFSCGSWIRDTNPPPSEAVWSHWQEVTAKITGRLDDVLSPPSTVHRVANPLEKARKMYRSCIQSDEVDEEEQLVALRGLLDELKGWPISRGYWEVEGYDWMVRVMEVTRLLGVRPLVKVSAGIDFKDTTKRVLYIKPGDLVFPRWILLHPVKYSNELNNYNLWIYHTFKHVYEKKLHLRTVKLDIMKILEFEISLAEFHAGAKTTERITLEKLSKRTKTNWTYALKHLFTNLPIEITENDTVVVNDVNNLRQLIEFINSQETRTIANYILWSVIKDLSRDTTRYMRILNFLMDRLILGVTSDLSRKQDCVGKVNEHLSFAVISEYVERFQKKNDIREVERMSQEIKKEFVSLLSGNKWLEEDTKKIAVEKVEALRSFVGYPEWVGNENDLLEFYRDLNVTDNHFENVLRMKRFTVEKEFLKLRAHTSQVDWPSSPFESNAYYSVLQNSIIIPLGILEPPFFDLERPELFNYGSLGSLIGHEISHSLDTTGRRTDKSGKFTNWWSIEDTNKYDTRSACFEAQYNAFGVDGAATIGENIADSVGLSLSYAAWKHSAKREIVFVPHLEEFTRDQLFYISFARSWCEISKLEIFNGAEHSPVKHRVSGTVYNMEEFRRAFSCENKGDPCVLW